jgi:hypothetical protein
VPTKKAGVQDADDDDSEDGAGQVRPHASNLPARVVLSSEEQASGPVGPLASLTENREG